MRGAGREKKERIKRKRKKEKKTVPRGQHYPSGIRDAHVVRKIILSLTKQEKGGAGRRKATDPNGKCPRVSNLLGFEIKSFCLIPLPPPPGSQLLPVPSPPQGVGPGREQEVCLALHVPSILLPQC